MKADIECILISAMAKPQRKLGNMKATIRVTIGFKVLAYILITDT